MDPIYGSRIDFHYNINGRSVIKKELRNQTDLLKVIEILLEKHNKENDAFNIDFTLNIIQAGN